MIRGRTEAETCRLNGWTVGTRLVGEDDGYGETTIEITAIGRDRIFAINEHRGVVGQENQWSLGFREWAVAS